MFIITILPIGMIGGAIAALPGFGIGSLLTLILAHQIGTKLAVAAVAIPDLCGTALRYWFLREHIDFSILDNFGLTSATAGLVGTLLHNYAKYPALSFVLSGLLVRGSRVYTEKNPKGMFVNLVNFAPIRPGIYLLP